jgi:hypothetical protein
MVIAVSMSAQTFERFGFWMSQNPGATQEQKEEKLAEIKANPLKGYVTDYEQKLEDLRLRHKKFFLDTTVPALKKRLKKDGVDKKSFKDMMKAFEEAVNTARKAHWEEGMKVHANLNNAERLSKMTKSVKRAERDREDVKKMVDDIYEETLKMINNLPPVSSFVRPTNGNDISDAEIVPPKAETAAEANPEAVASNNAGNNKQHKKN